ncbi:hypothetical protein [Actinomadura sp. HBU206391]|uniref:hypothetical protein n=1 Tax=Actinomadura sp. HBU206391 TaxID=2731692 RepID=UPI00164F70B3|nr:hypothetical protein [Actinomadura sp. HBU206391]MBC6462411.1 hypothetical protein [Actinomadura sp. HBU206391]
MNTTITVWMDPTPGLQTLRATFPHWGFLYNPFAYQWLAIRAQHPTLSADTPEDLARDLGRYEQQATKPPAGHLMRDQNHQTTNAQQQRA